MQLMGIFRGRGVKECIYPLNRDAVINTRQYSLQLNFSLHHNVWMCKLETQCLRNHKVLNSVLNKHPEYSELNNSSSAKFHGEGEWNIKDVLGAGQEHFEPW